MVPTKHEFPAFNESIKGGKTNWYLPMLFTWLWFFLFQQTSLIWRWYRCSLKRATWEKYCLNIWATGQQRKSKMVSGFFFGFFFLFWPSCNEVAECTYPWKLPWGSCTLYLNSVLFLIDMQYWCDFNFPEGVKVITEALVKSVTYKEDALEIQLKDGRMVSLWSLFFTKVL